MATILVDEAVAQLRSMVPQYAQYESDECLVVGVEMMFLRAVRQLRGTEALPLRVSAAAGSVIAGLAGLLVVLGRHERKPVPVSLPAERGL